jgi:hypothetical protein
MVLFPDRSYDSIFKKSRKLGVKWKIILVLEQAWSEYEKQILIENFNNPNLQQLINRSKSAIQQQLNKMNLFTRNKYWSSNEDKYLIKNYFNASIDEITTNLKRTWNSIKLRANKLNLKRSNEFLQKSNLKKLLNGSNETFYWLGFLIADGHFDFKNKRISLTTSIKDLEHIKKYAKFIETKNILINEKTVFHKVSVSTQNIDLFSDITTLIDINESNKTHIPNSLVKLKISKEQMISLIIGFIDGDGHIRKQTNRNDYLLHLHIHRNWLDNLYFIEEFLYKYFNENKEKTLSKIGNDGYARLMISNNTILKKLKLEVINLDIPYLERKWSIIDENKINKRDIISIKKNKIILLYKKGLTPVDIINTKEFTKSLVYKTIKGLN